MPATAIEILQVIVLVTQFALAAQFVHNSCAEGGVDGLIIL